MRVSKRRSAEGPKLEDNDLTEHPTKEIKVKRPEQREHFVDLIIVGLMMFIAGLVTGIGLHAAKLI
jgi:hypothetical protein